jgi:hypothetical protein
MRNYDHREHRRSEPAGHYKSDPFMSSARPWSSKTSTQIIKKIDLVTMS